jgi:hypothetical protein
MGYPVDEAIDLLAALLAQHGDAEAAKAAFRLELERWVRRV